MGHDDNIGTLRIWYKIIFRLCIEDAYEREKWISCLGLLFITQDNSIMYMQIFQNLKHLSQVFQVSDTHPIFIKSETTNKRITMSGCWAGTGSILSYLRLGTQGYVSPACELPSSSVVFRCGLHWTPTDRLAWCFLYSVQRKKCKCTVGSVFLGDCRVFRGYIGCLVCALRSSQPHLAAGPVAAFSTPAAAGRSQMGLWCLSLPVCPGLLCCRWMWEALEVLGAHFIVTPVFRVVWGMLMSGGPNPWTFAQRGREIKVYVSSPHFPGWCYKMELWWSCFWCQQGQLRNAPPVLALLPCWVSSLPAPVAVCASA